MISQRGANIIKYLTKLNSPIPVEELAERFNVSVRTIRYDLDKVDYFFTQKGLEKLMRIQNVGIRIAEKQDAQEIEKVLINLDNKSYIISPRDRKTLVFLLLMEMQDTQITYEKIANYLFVSRKTVIDDIKDLKKELEPYRVAINPVSNKGIILEGDEFGIRLALYELLIRIFTVTELWQVISGINPNKAIMLEKQLGRMIDRNTTEKCEIALREVERNRGTVLSDDLFYFLIVITAIAIMRQNKGYYVYKAILTPDHPYHNLVNEFCDNLRTTYGIQLDTSERAFIIALVNETGGGEVKLVTEEKATFFTDKLIAAVQHGMGKEFSRDIVLRKGLVQHFLRILGYGVRREKENENDTLVNNKNSVLFSIIERTIREFNEIKDIHSEITYIALHFLASEERETRYVEYRVLVVCANGIGTAKMVTAVLKKNFPEINVIDTASRHRVNELIREHHPDFIISTIPVNCKGIPEIEVQPLMSKTDIERVRKYLTANKANRVDRKNDNQLAYQAIMSKIENYCDITQEKRLTYELKRLLNIEQVYKGLKMQDVLSEETIRLNVDAKTWEGAVRKAGQLLLDTGSIAKRYIDAMISKVKELGPYIVIAPGVAMPHSSPDDGVIRLCMSLITLNKPINFGNKANDPVDIIICIGSTDNTSHIDLLTELISLVGSNEKLDMLRSAKSKDQVLKLLSKF